ncbi:hypothetical protein PO909_004266 [Leuciscus waleckii]
MSFRLNVLPRHRPFLRFAFEGRAYQYKVLPFGLALSPRVFTKVTEAAIAPMCERGVRILNYLNDWLILAQSREQLCEYRDMVLSHLSHLGLRVNWEKSKLIPGQRISFLGMELDSINTTASLTEARVHRGNAAQIASYEAAPTLAPRSSPKMGVAERLVPGSSDPGNCRQTLSLWSDPSFLRAGVPLEQVSRHSVVSTDASAIGCGATYNGHAASGSEPASAAFGGGRPIRALRLYVDRTQSLRTSDQLFVCYGGQQKGKAVSLSFITYVLSQFLPVCSLLPASNTEVPALVSACCATPFHWNEYVCFLLQSSSPLRQILYRVPPHPFGSQMLRSIRRQA